jgi:outer membrane protein TolC
MGRFHTITVLFLLGILAMGESVRAHTLSELIALAVAEHPAIRAADAEIDWAIANQKAADRAWAPRPSVEMGLSSVPLMEGDPFQSRVHPTLSGLYAHLRVEGAFVLYASGQFEALVRVADAGVSVAEAKKQVVIDEVAFQVTKAVAEYEMASHMQSRFEMMSDVLSNLEEQGDQDENADRSLVVRVLSGEAASRKIKAARGVLDARARLLVAVGSGQESELEMDVTGGRPLSVALLNLEACLSGAQAQRPDLQASRAGLNALEAEVQLRKRLFGPRLGILAEYRVSVAPLVENQTDTFRKDPYNSGAGGGAFGVDWDGEPGALLGNLRKSEARLGKLRSVVAFLEDKVSADVRESHRRAVLSQEVALAQSTSLRASKEWFDHAMERFGQQKISTRRFREAVLQYMDRLERSVKATRDFRVAVAGLGQRMSSTPVLNPSQSNSTF